MVVCASSTCSEDCSLLATAWTEQRYSCHIYLCERGVPCIVGNLPVMHRAWVGGMPVVVLGFNGNPRLELALSGPSTERLGACCRRMQSTALHAANYTHMPACAVFYSKFVTWLLSGTGIICSSSNKSPPNTSSLPRSAGCTWLRISRHMSCRPIAVRQSRTKRAYAHGLGRCIKVVQGHTWSTPRPSRRPRDGTMVPHWASRFVNSNASATAYSAHAKADRRCRRGGHVQGRVRSGQTRSTTMQRQAGAPRTKSTDVSCRQAVESRVGGDDRWISRWLAEYCLQGPGTKSLAFDESWQHYEAKILPCCTTPSAPHWARLDARIERAELMKKHR